MGVVIVEEEDAVLKVYVGHCNQWNSLREGWGRGSSETRSHPEMVSNMSHVTLNFVLSEIPFVHF